MWEHVKIAFRHQESLRGPHGGYLAGTNGDWSDFSAELLKMSESHARGGSARLRLSAAGRPGRPPRRPRFRGASFARRAAELRERRGARVDGARLVLARLQRRRSRSATGAIFGEPQPWAMLAGVPATAPGAHARGEHPPLPRPASAPPAASAVRRESGSAMSPAERDPLVTEAPDQPGAQVATAPRSGRAGSGSTSTAGSRGRWPSSTASSRRRARYAWDEYTRNTLAAHADAYPRPLGRNDLDRRRVQRVLRAAARLAAGSSCSTTTRARSPSSPPGWS